MNKIDQDLIKGKEIEEEEDIDPFEELNKITEHIKNKRKEE